MNVSSLLPPKELEALHGDVCFFQSRYGNRLAYHDFGDPQGEPILFFHGAGTHVHVLQLHRPAVHYGLRIIVVDRPGVAQSEFRRGWTLLEFAQDMVDLLDHLGIAVTGAVGVSGGGPSLLATAHRFPERLRYVVSLACVMPVPPERRYHQNIGITVRILGRLGRHLPLELFRLPYSLLGFLQTRLKSPEAFARLFASSLSEADQALFREPDFQYQFMRDFQELFRNGSRGPAYDVQNFHKPWGFDLSDIILPIDAVHGDEDRIVPPVFSEYLKEHARQVRLEILPGEGHLCHTGKGFETLRRIVAWHHPDKLKPEDSGPPT
jgi:pimeloyl-ACP methyl ester carboxylesterase